MLSPSNRKFIKMAFRIFKRFTKNLTTTDYRHQPGRTEQNSNLTYPDDLLARIVQEHVFKPEISVTRPQLQLNHRITEGRAFIVRILLENFLWYERS